MIGIAYEGLAIPVMWQFLNKAGNASAKEHIDILRRFVRVISKECIAGILGDREFASGKLFKWCNKQEVPFYIRIKEDRLVRVKRRRIGKAKKFFNDLKYKEHKAFPMTIWLFDQKVYLAGSRSERGELMIIATNQAPKNAVSIYLRRWEIEPLFQGLKNRGFRLEETRLTELERIDKLVVLLAIGFCWAHKIGEWRAILRPIVWNKYQRSVNNGLRPQYSYFRYGFDWIRGLLLQLKNSAKEFRICLKQIYLPDFYPKGALL